MTMKLDILSHKVLFERFFRLDEYRFHYETFAGGSHEVVREVFERGKAVAVLPYDKKRDEIVMVEQIRPGALAGEESPWLLELIAGVMDKADEPPEAVVRREAYEEAGCKLEDIKLLYDYWVSPGGSSERVKLYYAEISTTGLGGVFGVADEHEDIKVHVIPREDAMHMLEQGKINNALAIIGLQWLQLNYQKIQK